MAHRVDVEPPCRGRRDHVGAEHQVLHVGRRHDDPLLTGQALGDADIITVQDLYATEVVTVNIDVGAGDAAIDAVTVNGRNVADDISVSAVGTQVRVQGLRYNVNVTNSIATDTLTVNGNDGDDAIRAVPGVQALADLTFNGNQGDDLLVGSPGDDTLSGGNHSASGARL